MLKCLRYPINTFYFLVGEPPLAESYFAISHIVEFVFNVKFVLIVNFCILSFLSIQRNQNLIIQFSKLRKSDNIRNGH